MPVLFGLLMLTSPSAMAQSRECDPINHEEWWSRMGALEQWLQNAEMEQARGVFQLTQESLPCLDQIARPSHLARWASLYSWMEWNKQNEEEALKWVRAANDIAPRAPDPAAAFPEDLVTRFLLEEYEQAVIAGPDDQSLVVPKGGGASFIDGALAVVPKLRSETPHLIQIADKKGVIVDAWWQDGAGFPEGKLGDLAKKMTAPWWQPESSAPAPSAPPPTPEPGPVTSATPDPEPGPGASVTPEPEPAPAPEPEPERAPAVQPPTEPAVAADPTPVVPEPEPEPEPEPPPAEPVTRAPVRPEPAPRPEPVVREPVVREPRPRPEPVALSPKAVRLILGGALAVAGGGLYGAALASEAGLKSMGPGNTPEELTAARSRTNLLTLGAALVGAGGIGVGVTAFVGTDGPRVGMNLRF